MQRDPQQRQPHQSYKGSRQDALGVSLAKAVQPLPYLRALALQTRLTSVLGRFAGS